MIHEKETREQKKINKYFDIELKMALNTSSEHKLRLSDVTGEPKRMLPPIKGFENLEIVSLEKAIEPLISIVPEIEQMIYVVKQNCVAPQDHLTSDESGSIMLYSMEWYSPEKSFYFYLNQNLRSENRQLLKPWFFYLRLFLHSLSKLPSFNRTIYRGIKMDLINEYPLGRTFVWWAFSSCTDSIGTLENEQFFGQTGQRTLFMIQSSTGVNIRDHSMFPSENEVLLICARQFQVVSHLNAGNDLHLIQIKEIEPPFPFVSYSSSATASVHSSNRLNPSLDNCQMNFDNQKLNDEDLKLIVEKKQYRKLSLQNNHLTSQSGRLLCQIIKTNVHLEELMLYHNYLSDIGIQYLCESLSTDSCQLKTLGIGWNGITDCGIKFLSQMIRINRSLITLGLVFNEITDRGVQLLFDAIRHSQTNIQILHLSKNQLITDNSIDFLIRILSNRNLSIRELWMQNCGFSINGKQRFKQNLKSRSDFRLEL